MNRFFVFCILIASSAIASAASGTEFPKQIIPDCLGVNIHFTGPEQKQVDQIADAGFKFIRMDFAWSSVEREKGKYDFKTYDELYNTLQSRGIRPLFILDYGSPLYDDGLAPHSDEAINAFAAFAAASATHFKGKGVIWEIWNEPNLSLFWKPQPTADGYIKLAKQTYEAMKKADPETIVIGPALACWDFGYMDALLRLGLLDCVDAVSLHPYGSATPEDAFEYYKKIRDMIAQYAPKEKMKPLISGEWGYTSINNFSPENQAQYLARMFLVNTMNDIKLSIWYDWRNDGPDRTEKEHNFGTVNEDFTPKPAYTAMQTLAKELEGFEYAARLQSDSEKDYLPLYKKGNSYRLAAWTTSKPHSITIPMDSPKVAIVSLTGERKQVLVKNGKLELDLTGSVQYIEPLALSRRWAIEAEWRNSAITLQENSTVVAEVTTEIPGTSPELTVSGDGVQACTVKSAESGGKINSIKCRTKFFSNGNSQSKVRVSVKVAEFKEPFVRMVDIDTSACPTIEVPPASKDMLVLIVRQPLSGKGEAFTGKLLVENLKGIKLANTAGAINFGPGLDWTILNFRITEKPAGIYSFSCKLVNNNGDEIVSIPVKRYSIAETFAEGTPGSPVTNYKAELDGDPKTGGTASLTYTDAPGGAPAPVCAKLDYNLDSGWKFIRISPSAESDIPDKPQRIKIWVRSDGNKAIARLRFAGSDSQVFQPEYGKLDFGNWRVLESNITGKDANHWSGPNDGVVRYPIKWDTLFLMDSLEQKMNGAIYLGPAMLCYE